MDELISRQAAIAELNAKYHGMISDESMKIYQIINWLDNLPSAEPQERKTGRWEDGHRYGYNGTYWFIYCSECMYERDDDDHEKDTPFCPNCGARMEVEHE